ncbi:MAG: S8 family serine peptidase [Rhodothermales bacterium]|nr:S8 family serine peptidase [Rhodothermales bacterium]
MKKPSLSSRWLGIMILGLLFFSPSLLQGCDAMIGDDPNGTEPDALVASVPVEGDGLRHAHLLDKARTKATGAGKVAGEATLNLVLGMATYEANGITPRIVNKFDVTNRLLNKFGEGITIKSEISTALDALTLTLNESQLDSLLALIESDPDLSWLEPDPLLGNELAEGTTARVKRRQNASWSIAHIGAEKAPVPLDASRLRVYVVDTGVNPISDLNLVGSVDFTPYMELRVPGVDGFEGMRTMNPNRDRPDSLGHGTHIAGIIGALNNDGGVLGVFPGVAISSIKVMNSAGVTDMTVLLKAVDYIMEEKLANPDLQIVVNMSLGADLESREMSALDMAIRKSIGIGIVYVTAAGNDGRDAITYSPAHVPEAITVGAYDQSDRFAAYSNYGSTIDLLAPGTDILSLSAFGSDVLMLSSGTSMAAPHVAAMAARYLTLNPGQSAAQVQTELMSRATYGILSVPAGTTGAAVSAR